MNTKLTQVKERAKKRIKCVWGLFALLLLGVILWFERKGIVINADMPSSIVQNMQRGDVSRNEHLKLSSDEIDTLILVDEKDKVSLELLKEAEIVLKDMRVGYETIDISEFKLEHLSDYSKLVMTISNLDLIGEEIGNLARWVKNGGCMMNMVTFENVPNLEILSDKMGIVEGGKEYVPISGIVVDDEFMIGAARESFLYEEEYWSNLNVLLDEECKVYVRDVKTQLPLLWEKDYGEGKFVITNQVLMGKIARGFLSAAYSLMDDICVYPVIDASAFYLDDFPAPVPAGNGKYIEEEYGMDISNFYSNIWWEDMLNFEKKYGIKHTGLIIEDYSDIVEEPFVSQTSLERFKYFGNMLLNHGGELGFHGYNHMPLCMEGFDYLGEYDSYNLWKNKKDMKNALQELRRFSNQLFPDYEFCVYVPPSNILSEEGRKVLVNTFPELRAIASTYLTGGCVYVQEFGIGADGVVETPRITSGAVLDEYSYLMAFSELNYHYVQSHFIHPDDALDEDRGAALGWTQMSENLDDYMKYIYESAPNLTNVSGSEMADKVEDWALLSMKRTMTENGMDIKLGDFNESASLMMRINIGDGETPNVEGASLEHLTGNLYLLKAYQPDIKIRFKN